MKSLKLFLILLFILSLSNLSVFAKGSIADSDALKARKDPDSFSSFAYAIDPSYNITKGDIDLVKSDPNSKFALGLGLNSNYKIKQNDRNFIKENPNSLFAFALAQNQNYEITDEDKKFISDNPSTLLSFSLIRNLSFNESKNASKSGKSSILFIRNFQTWLSEKGIQIPPFLSSSYAFVAGILKAPVDFLQYNFELFDFLEKPLLQWNGWTVIHFFVVFLFFMTILSAFIPRQTNTQN